MIRAVLVILAAAVVGSAGGMAVYAAWPKSPAGPSQQVCQFARWENQQLWPQGGGPPLPPGC